MFDTIATLYVEAFGILLTAAAIGLLTLGAARAAPRVRRPMAAAVSRMPKAST